MQWVFGAAVVLLYGADRFKIPRPMRATTTFWRYWSAWCGYLVAMTGLFILLGGGFTVIDAAQLLKVLGVEHTMIEGILPGPLLSALLLTSLLPHVPVLGRIDSNVKEWFQRVGNIPFEVRELSGRLRAATYAPSPNVLEALLPTLNRLGVDASWLQDAANTIRQPWAQAVALFAQVQAWETARGYSRYFEEHKATLGEIRTRLESLREVLQPLALAELDRSHDSALLSRMRKRIASEVTDLRRDLCDYVSGGVLSEGRNHSQRLAALTQLGFSGLPATRNPLSANDIVLVMGLVFLAMLFIPLMTRRFFDPTPLSNPVRLMILVPLIYAIAVVAAIYPKSAWPFARRNAGDGRPVAGYAASAALAAVAAFLVALLLRFAFDAQGNVFQALATPGAFRAAWLVSLDRWPWQFMTFFVTVAIAWMADDYADRNAEPGWLRWAEAVALCAIFVILQWVVAQLFAAAEPRMAELLRKQIPLLLTTAGATGAGIGWLVPHAYRRRGRRQPVVAIGNAAPA